MFIIRSIFKGKEEILFWDGKKKVSPCRDFFPEVNSLLDLLKLKANDLLTVRPDFEHEWFGTLLPLVDEQKILATGCTYRWSEEKLTSTDDSNVYKKVYLSNRPMIFLKGSRENLAAYENWIGIRCDSTITIPEAELVAVYNTSNELLGFTLGNDVTALDIERENPLYQMQAKYYPGSVSLLPVIKLSALLPVTEIHCNVFRNEEELVQTAYSTREFCGNLSAIAETIKLAGHNSKGAFIFLGCGTGYPDEYALIENDRVVISSDLFPIKLSNFCKRI